MPPLFITFEGLDGSGKTTHLQRAGAWLERCRVPHLTTHEPGGTPLGDALRSIFLDPRWGVVDGTVELLMIFASRRQHLLEVIEPALAAGRHVLCDRFTDSTRAYQGEGRGVPLDLIDRIDELATGARQPDLTLLFDLPAEQARARRLARARNRRGGGVAGRPGSDRLDVEEIGFYERVRQGFLRQAALAPGRFRIIDSAGEPARTEEQVRTALGALANSAGAARAGAAAGTASLPARYRP